MIADSKPRLEIATWSSDLSSRLATWTLPINFIRIKCKSDQDPITMFITTTKKRYVLIRILQINPCVVLPFPGSVWKWLYAALWPLVFWVSTRGVPLFASIWPWKWGDKGVWQIKRIKPLELPRKRDTPFLKRPQTNYGWRPYQKRIYLIWW